MRLKTTLVLAITGLVFLIAGLISFVYVEPNNLRAAVRQSYRDRPCGGRGRSGFGCKRRRKWFSEEQKVDPNNFPQPYEFRGEAHAVRNDASLQDAIESAHRLPRQPSVTSTSVVLSTVTTRHTAAGSEDLPLLRYDPA